MRLFSSIQTLSSNQPSSDLQPVLQPSAQRPLPLTFLYSNLVGILSEPVIGLIQEYYVAPKEEVTEFLKLIAEGEQGKAEYMLESNPALALVSGDVTDLSKRTFTGITAFQYAVWALDWHMWTMIRKYLPDDEAKQQAEGFETGAWVKNHGVHAQHLLDNLVKALQLTIDLYNANKYTECDTAWVQQVGGAQLTLPAHMINEYCHPTRSFSPCPNFREMAALPRTREVDGEEWFTAIYNGGKLGEKFAIYRGPGRARALTEDFQGVRGVWKRVVPWVYGGGWDADEQAMRGQCGYRPGPPETDGRADRDSIRTLASVRTAQREELINELKTRSTKRKAT